MKRPDEDEDKFDHDPLGTGWTGGTNMHTQELIQQAQELGKLAGENAAAYVFDGNTAPETYIRILRMYDDGDPALYDMIREPDLSGEYADDPTPASLAKELGIDEDDERLNDMCTAWVEEAHTSFWEELIRTIRDQVELAPLTPQEDHKT